MAPNSTGPGLAGEEGSMRLPPMAPANGMARSRRDASRRARKRCGETPARNRHRTRPWIAMPEERAMSGPASICPIGKRPIRPPASQPVRNKQIRADAIDCTIAAERSIASAARRAPCAPVRSGRSAEAFLPFVSVPSFRRGALQQPTDKALALSFRPQGEISCPAHRTGISPCGRNDRFFGGLFPHLHEDLFMQE